MPEILGSPHVWLLLCCWRDQFSVWDVSGKRWLRGLKGIAVPWMHEQADGPFNKPWSVFLGVSVQFDPAFSLTDTVVEQATETSNRRCTRVGRRSRLLMDCAMVRYILYAIWSFKHLCAGINLTGQPGSESHTSGVLWPFFLYCKVMWRGIAPRLIWHICGEWALRRFWLLWQFCSFQAMEMVLHAKNGR